MKVRTARYGKGLATGFAVILLTIAVLNVGVVPSLPTGAAAAEPAETGAPQKDGQEKPPMRIWSDAAEYHNKGNLVIFMGNVVVTQSDSTLTADRVELVFTPAEGPEGTAGAPDAPGTARGPGAGEGAVGAMAETGRGRQIKTITALDNVSFRQVDPETKKERYATGDRAVYDAESKVVTMTGSPKLWEGRNVIAGQKMIFHIEDQDVVFKGTVNLTVFPEEVDLEKRP